MNRTSEVCLRHRAKQLETQIKDINGRIERYDDTRRLELRLSVTRLEARLRQVHHALRELELAG